MNTFNDLTGLYSLSKTLRFELKPIGKTLENIERKGIIEQDTQREKEYQKVKEIIDEYHKAFIKMCLWNFELKLKSDGSSDSLEDYVRLASIEKREELEENEFTKVKENLRKQIVIAFKEGSSFGDLFKKELILKHLPNFVTDDNERQMVDNFSKFTTYFRKFQMNRENMYSDEEKSTAIAYRLIHENLPTFIDNLKVFSKIASTSISEHFADVRLAYQEYLNVESIDEMFQLDYFTKTLTQEQIEVYNNVIGGKSCEDGNKIQGLNEYVNLYNQQQKDRTYRLPMLKPLYKMILSDRVALSWLPDDFVSDEEMLDAINNVYDSLKDILTKDDESSLKNLLTSINQYDADHIYICNDIGLTDISQQMFGRYDVFTSGIKKTKLRNRITLSAKEKREPELFDDRINKLFKSAKSFAINDLNSFAPDGKTIQSYFAQLGAFDREGVQSIDFFSKIEMAHIAASDILEGKHAHINQSETDIKLIKDLLDAYKDLQHFIKPLLGNGDEANKDNDFYARLRAVWDSLDVITPLYNKVRNWLTRKPYSTEKIKLNFENAVLLSGWSSPKDNMGALLKDNKNTYYLAILDNNARTILNNCPGPIGHNDTISLVQYIQGGSMDKNIQNLMYVDGVIRKVNGRREKDGSYAGQNIRLEEAKMKYLPAEINRIRKSGSYLITSDCFSKEDLINYIEYYKPLTCAYYSSYKFSFKESSQYKSFADFTKHINQQAYQLQFVEVSKRHIARLVDEGKLYLFQIWNKDFSEHSKGTPNMHTLYWNMLFDENNLADVVYKLNGEAEVFYRKSSLQLENTTVHKANQAIKNKNVQNKKDSSIFKYDIIKDRRYTVDKFQFHVPITLNFKATGNDNINSLVHDVIRNNGIEHIIGIDRGERHLLYLSLIDFKGNIVKQMTLNYITNEYNGNIKTNYKDLLANREGDRTEARRNWQKIDNIKDIKEGYLSQVVHIIAKMMVEYKAIVVLEDLNKGFIRGRQKVERNVYEQFEKRLIDKLNYFVDKQKPAVDNGGLMHALQLASKFDSSKKLDKQSGCLFFIPAWKTSKIDPVTGFVNLLDTHYENVGKAQCFFSKFDSIRYNSEKEWFEFKLDYDKFTEKAKGTQTHWTLCSYGTRIRTFRNPSKLNQWDNEEVTLTDEFKKVFQNANIDISGNLKNSICSITDKNTLETLMQLMRMLVQMRNSITGTETDYLLSPVADANGTFYDSRNEISTLPKDADANGAYNIARKGLWIVRKIQQSQPGKKLNLSISNKEWLQFAQQKPYLND